MDPRVSVVLPVYNDALYIRDAVESLLKQSFKNFEIIIVDDRSTDDTAEVIKALTDPRIVYVRNEKNLGRAGSDNFALSLVKGEYIAKMDSDDLCHPDRLQKQVAYLDAHPEINVVGSWMQNFGSSNYLNKYPESVALARAMTLFTLPVGNPSVMLRTSLLRDQSLVYDARLRQTEDFDFFARYAAELAVVTLPEPLLLYRTYPDTAKKEILAQRHQAANAVRENFLKKWGVPFDQRELAIHHLVAHLDVPLEPYSLPEVEAWLAKLAAYNEQNPFFEQPALLEYLGFRWFNVCYRYPQKNFGSIRHFSRSALGKYYPVPFSLKTKFFIKSLKALS